MIALLLDNITFICLAETRCRCSAHVQYADLQAVDRGAKERAQESALVEAMRTSQCSLPTTLTADIFRAQYLRLRDGKQRKASWERPGAVPGFVHVPEQVHIAH